MLQRFAAGIDLVCFGLIREKTKGKGQRRTEVFGFVGESDRCYSTVDELLVGKSRVVFETLAAMFEDPEGLSLACFLCRIRDAPSKPHDV